MYLGGKSKVMDDFTRKRIRNFPGISLLKLIPCLQEFASYLKINIKLLRQFHIFQRKGIIFILNNQGFLYNHFWNCFL
jgi:hypothetical protein